MKRLGSTLAFSVLSFFVLFFMGCSGSGTADTGSGGHASAATGGATASTGGAKGASGGVTGSSGGTKGSSGGAVGSSGGVTGSSGGAHGPAGGATGSKGGAMGSNGGASGSTTIMGTIGTLGSAKPTVSSLWISNSGETLIYLSSAAITCDLLKMSRWLGMTTAGSQVVEIVIKGAPKVADYPVPPSEVNYAAGGKSSSYESVADSGKISFTVADAQVVEGTVMATYGANSINGTFHAEFCAGGQGY